MMISSHKLCQLPLLLLDFAHSEAALLLLLLLAARIRFRRGSSLVSRARAPVEITQTCGARKAGDCRASRQPKQDVGSRLASFFSRPRWMNGNSTHDLRESSF